MGPLLEKYTSDPLSYAYEYLLTNAPFVESEAIFIGVNAISPEGNMMCIGSSSSWMCLNSFSSTLQL
jgi:hypothetical protein